MRCAPQWTRMAAVLVASVLASILATSSALAHSGGKADLLVVGASVTADPAGLRLDVEVVDADSGEPQPGYTTTVAAQGPETSSGVVRLEDLGEGRYGGPVGVTPGRWELLVRVDQGPGAPPGTPTSVNLVADVAADGEVTLVQGPPGQSSLPLLEVGSIVVATALGVLVLTRRRRKAAA